MNKRLRYHLARRLRWNRFGRFINKSVCYKTHFFKIRSFSSKILGWYSTMFNKVYGCKSHSLVYIIAWSNKFCADARIPSICTSKSPNATRFHLKWQWLGSVPSSCDLLGKKYVTNAKEINTTLPIELDLLSYLFLESNLQISITRWLLVNDTTETKVSTKQANQGNHYR